MTVCCDPPTKNTSLIDVLNVFVANATKLYASRPWWLINESLVRSELVSAILSFLTPEQCNELTPRALCTEDHVGLAKKIDLVCRLPKVTGVELLLVEFKGWNIVTKCPDGIDCQASNASKTAVQTQLKSIRKDARKLARITKTTRLIVIHAQTALPADLAIKHAGRKRRQPIDLSIVEQVKSAKDFRDWWCSENNCPPDVDLGDHVGADGITCAAGSNFIIRVFEVDPTGGCVIP